MTDEKNLPEETPKFDWVPPRDGHAIPELYSNYIVSSWTMYDVRARIGQLIPSGPGAREFVVEERAALTLSWARAKAVANMLAKLVSDYEKRTERYPS
jgi:hypothetical protein